MKMNLSKKFYEEISEIRMERMMNKSIYTENDIANLHLKTILFQHPDLKIEQDEYNINVTSNEGDKLFPAEVEKAFSAHDGANKEAHLYFHVPLCDYICHFCNYVKKKISDNVDIRGKTLEKWTTLLIEESNRYLQRFPWIAKAKIESFYIGGGTAATLKKEHLARVLKHVTDNYTLAHNCEISLEGNPDNFSSQYINDAIELGFNRFSLGVQSLQDEVLQFVNRGHTVKMSLDSIATLKKTGMPFNVDYIFGMPYQTTEIVKNEIEFLVALGIPTITIYRLRNADRASMGIGNCSQWNNPRVRDQLHAKGLFPVLETTYEMRQEAAKVFLQHRYYPSPCGWWSKEGAYPDGNIPRVSRNKWQRYDTMIAFGPGAYGWLTGDSAEIIQTHNDASIGRYEKIMETTKELPLAYGRKLSGNNSIATRLGFAFKANQPIALEEYKQRFGVDIFGNNPIGDVINEMLDKQFLEYLPDRKSVRPTLKGEALHEEIISVYLHNRIGGLHEIVCKKAGA